MRTKCPCCGNLTLSEKPRNGDVCPVCYWEYDRLQNEDAEYDGGANRVSLNRARDNYCLYQASEERYAPFVINAEEYKKMIIEYDMQNECPADDAESENICTSEAVQTGIYAEIESENGDYGDGE